MLKIFLMSEVRQPKFRDLVALASMRAASSGRCHKFRCLHLSKMSRVSQEWTGLQHRVHEPFKGGSQCSSFASCCHVECGSRFDRLIFSLKMPGIKNFMWKLQALDIGSGVQL